MRFSLAVAVFSAVLSTASASFIGARQDGNFPPCALPCVMSPASTFGCSSTDNGCLCRSPQFVAQGTACIEAACSGDDIAAAEKFSQEICLTVGVTLTATPSGSATDSSSATDSGSPTSSGSSSSPSVTAPSSSSSSPAPSQSSGSGSPSTSGPAPTNTNSAASTGINAGLGLVALAFAALNL